VKFKSKCFVVNSALCGTAEGRLHAMPHGRESVLRAMPHSTELRLRTMPHRTEPQLGAMWHSAESTHICDFLCKFATICKNILTPVINDPNGIDL
jgi:hypothetical protein